MNIPIKNQYTKSSTAIAILLCLMVFLRIAIGSYEIEITRPIMKKYSHKVNSYSTSLLIKSLKYPLKKRLFFFLCLLKIFYAFDYTIYINFILFKIKSLYVQFFSLNLHKSFICLYKNFVKIKRIYIYHFINTKISSIL